MVWVKSKYNPQNLGTTLMWKAKKSKWSKIRLAWLGELWSHSLIQRQQEKEQVCKWKGLQYALFWVFTYFIWSFYVIHNNLVSWYYVTSYFLMHRPPTELCCNPKCLSFHFCQFTHCSSIAIGSLQLPKEIITQSNCLPSLAFPWPTNPSKRVTQTTRQTSLQPAVSWMEQRSEPEEGIWEWWA